MTILEIFACSGGMAEGLRRAGLRVTRAVEWDSDHAASYEQNLGHAPIVADARELLRPEWRHAHGIDAVELLVADPPCTPWSTAGKRLGQADPRDMLAVTCDIIATIRPRCWLVANVPGLVTKPNRHVVARTIESIPGYEVDYFRLDAADYGVPQRRRRPFWFGRPAGSPKLYAPEPTHIDPMRTRTLWDLRRLPWVTVRQALGHLPLEELGRPVRMAIKPRGSHHQLRAAHEPSDPNRPAQTVTTGARSGRSCIAYRPSSQGPQGGRVGDCDESARTVDSHAPRVGAGASAVLAWPWDRPATTVTADERIAAPGHHSGSFLSDPNAIVLSERERLILQGFPESWVMIAGATKKKRAAAIGMAMPPPLAEAVGRQIAAWLRATVERGCA